MSADRCPSCAAAVRPDASWCGLCYADLRPPPPAREPAPVLTAEVSAGPAQFVGPALTNAPVATVVEAPVADPLTGPLPGAAPVEPEPVTWPCGRCGYLVPFDEDACPDCHARFLESALPGTDRRLLDRLPKGQRTASTAFLVMFVGGLTLTGVFVGLFTLLSIIF
jgi:hypothetical protein